MKKYVKASQFSDVGSARSSDVRNGVVPFGRGVNSIVDLNSNWEAQLASEKTTYDVNTGRIVTSLNIRIKPKRSANIPNPGSFKWYNQLFSAYTPEEAEQLLAAARTMTDEELCELTLVDVSEHYEA